MKDSDKCFYPRCRKTATMSAAGRPLCDDHNADRLEIAYRNALSELAYKGVQE